MAVQPFDVVGIGNAIVDIIARAEDSFLEAQGMAKGGMMLIDEARAEDLYAAMGPAIEASGGSVGNTIAGLASLGARAAFIGKTRDDLLGKAFHHDITAIGVTYRTPAATSGPATARCFVLVSPDAQRTMNTFLGASVHLGEADLDVELIANAKVTYLEGYLFDQPPAQAAFHAAARIAHEAGRQVALSLSDAFCVHRHHAAFLAFIRDHVDILFANEIEAKALAGTENMDAALTAIAGMVELAAVTQGAEGSVVVHGSERIAVPAAPVERVVDTTGAGDLYAAGFLFGLTSGRSLADCARLGGLCAAEIISHYGARPETSLAALVGGA
jgi:sugar/nucleoside kinase (ribokinase family)